MSLQYLSDEQISLDILWLALHLLQLITSLNFSVNIKPKQAIKNRLQQCFLKYRAQFIQGLQRTQKYTAEKNSFFASSKAK